MARIPVAPLCPQHLDKFLADLTNPDDIAWQGGQPQIPDYFPPEDELRQLLLEKPWEPDHRTAQWLVAMGRIGHSHG